MQKLIAFQLILLTAVSAFGENVFFEPDGTPEMDLECPQLTCDDNELEDNKCYQHDGEASSKQIKGALCYDVENAKQTDKKLVCPFNTDEYMWINELLQGQQRNEGQMKCKLTQTDIHQSIHLSFCIPPHVVI